MRIAILAASNVPWLDLFGPIEVFLEATRLSGRPDLYEVQVFGTAPGPIADSCGLSVVPSRTIKDLAGSIDTLVVAGGPQPNIDDVAATWLAACAGRLRRCGAVGTGTFLLAASHLLDGRRATTHWQHAQRLTELFPNVTVDPNPIFVKDGKYYTSAGESAGLDLALALVEEDAGQDLALAVARRLVMFLKRPAGQSQLSIHLAAQLSTASATQHACQWILANLTESLAVERLAKQAGMSTRNFSRVFRREIGITPTQFVETARIEAARRALEDTDVPLKRVAALCGFSSTDGMRGAFYRRVGMTAHCYRAMFRARLPEHQAARLLLANPTAPMHGSSPALAAPEALLAQHRTAARAAGADHD
jgi:transcriptional regulator GlxA family with amidase domain